MRFKPPLRQGGVDALCGPYSVVNAFRYLCGYDDEACKAIMRSVLAQCGELVSSSYGVGMDDGEMSRVIAAACETHPQSPWKVSWDRTHVLVDTAEKFMRRLYAADAVTESGDDVGDVRVAHILGLDGLLPHWTVVRKATPVSLHVYDSTGLTRLDRDDLAVVGERRSVFNLNGRQVFRVTATRVAPSNPH